MFCKDKLGLTCQHCGVVDGLTADKLLRKLLVYTEGCIKNVFSAVVDVDTAETSATVCLKKIQTMSSELIPHMNGIIKQTKKEKKVFVRCC